MRNLTSNFFCVLLELIGFVVTHIIRLLGKITKHLCYFLYRAYTTAGPKTMYKLPSTDPQATRCPYHSDKLQPEEITTDH